MDCLGTQRRKMALSLSENLAASFQQKERNVGAVVLSLKIKQILLKQKLVLYAFMHSCILFHSSAKLPPKNTEMAFLFRRIKKKKPRFNLSPCFCHSFHLFFSPFLSHLHLICFSFCFRYKEAGICRLYMA